MEHQAQSSRIFDQPMHCGISPATNAGSIKSERQPRDLLYPRLGQTATLSHVVVTRPRNTRDDAAIGIGQARDGLHRIQAILTYIKITNRKIPEFGPIFDEAKCTYEQALSLYEGRDFESAIEFASASRELSRVLEIITSRTLRSDPLYPTLVLLPSAHQTTVDDSIRMQEELYRVECMLSFIHCVAENGAVLSEDKRQIISIASCTERLLRKAGHLRGCAEMQEAIDLVHAAAVTAHAAEHVCKRRCAMQGIDPFLSPNDSHVMCDESSERDCEYNGSYRILHSAREETVALVDHEGRVQG